MTSEKILEICKEVLEVSRKCYDFDKKLGDDILDALDDFLNRVPVVGDQKSENNVKQNPENKPKKIEVKRLDLSKPKNVDKEVDDIINEIKQGL